MIKKLVFPLLFAPKVVIAEPGDFARLAIGETNRQLSGRVDADDFDLCISTDALNYWRIRLRVAQELNIGEGENAPESVQELNSVCKQIREEICRSREFQLDEFETVIHAVRGRVRHPYGAGPVDLALYEAEKEPIQLLDPELRDSKIITQIASLAFYLQQNVGEKNFLLPLDYLRKLYSIRKTAVGGAIMRLKEAGLISEVSDFYHTGRAKEFRFTGIEGTHFQKGNA